jgi:plasmid stabilization system protein ParE
MKVTISERAERNLDDLMEYLEKKWSVKVKENFRQKLLSTVHLISKNPHLYPVSQIKKGVHKCVVTKHNSIYYRVAKNEIEIITIQDNRRNPKKLKL